MRTSWIMGIVMFYIITLFLQMFVTGQFEMTDENKLGRILDGYNPSTRQDEGLFPGGFQAYTNTETSESSTSFLDPFALARIVKAVGSMGVLYHPALFTGNYVFAWYILCLPIALAFWITLGLAIVRGVGSG